MNHHIYLCTFDDANTRMEDFEVMNCAPVYAILHTQSGGWRSYPLLHTQPNSRGFWDHRRISTSIDCTAKNELYRAQFSINIMYNVPSFKHYVAMNNSYPWWLWACRIGRTLLYPLNLSCSTVFTQKSHCFEFHVSMVERLYHYNLSFYINMIVVVHR